MTFIKRTDEQAAGPSQSAGPSAPKVADPGSQGTNSVHGTWSSEGEAGRHFRSKAGPEQGTSSPESILQRLERPAGQADLARDLSDLPGETLERELAGLLAQELVFEEQGRYLSLVTT